MFRRENARPLVSSTGTLGASEPIRSDSKKKNQQGKWRLITDLSSPQGHSVNDGIDPALCSLSYTSVDDAAAEILAMGRGTLLAKLDIKNAYRIVPVHPEDRPLLGTKWQDKIFIDAVLPFGLRSAPKIFNAIADALEWIFARSGIYPTHHYLDDFIFFGHPGTNQCADALTTAIASCNKLGVPLALDKLLGPSTVLPFLGIELDTATMELRLLADKLYNLQSLIKSWQGRKSCTKRELLSLIGHLQHAGKVVKPGRTFVIALQYISPNHYYVLSRISPSHGSPKMIFTRLEEKDQNNI